MTPREAELEANLRSIRDVIDSLPVFINAQQGVQAIDTIRNIVTRSLKD